VRPFIGGLARDQHCFGANKISMLSAKGFAPPWAVAYTDHSADIPVLTLSTERVLVSPKPRCLALIRQSIAGEATIVGWR
jgi:phosphatidylglycerophosphatase C